nr:MAG TPA: immunity protein [Crassvirales sp.]
MNKERVSYLTIIGALLIVIGVLVGKITSNSYELSKLQDTVTKQAAAIEQLEKLQNNTISYIPKHADSISE